jgi:xanthine dehydrogenase accessory factor
MGKMLGFRVVVIDPRPEYNNSERFPNADSLMVEEYDSAFPKLGVGEGSYVIIYTTGHALDEQCLHFAVTTKAKYIGMIGSKKKVKEVKERLVQKGVPQRQLDRVNAPIGIEIGAETPEEIAISILAEIIKAKRIGGKSHAV